MRRPPPRNRADLRRRAAALADRPLAHIAREVGAPVPVDLRRDKGWIGTLMEAALGASAGQAAEPDFPALGVELKTIPLRDDGRPRESTYVCTAPLDGSMERTWEACWVRRKLATVLWVPILGTGAPGARRVGTPVLWQPTAAQEALLQADWEGLAETIALGAFDQIDARRGRVLQLRPKAASAAERVWALDAEGEWVQVVPRGFYLRARFTRELLAHGG